MKNAKVENTSSLLRNYVDSFSKDIFSTNGKVIKCEACDKTFGSEKTAPMKSQIEQHIKTNTHQNNIKKNEKKKQQFVTFPQNNSNSNLFFNNLCELMVFCDIPFNKLTSLHFKIFFWKNIQNKMYRMNQH